MSMSGHRSYTVSETSLRWTLVVLSCVIMYVSCLTNNSSQLILGQYFIRTRNTLSTFPLIYCLVDSLVWGAPLWLGGAF